MKKKVLSVFLVLAMILSVLPMSVFAAENSNADSDFVIDENGVLTAYNGIGGDVVIPDGVTAIGSAVFAAKEITSVIIPGNVEIIDEGAFGNCQQLKSVTVLGGAAIKGAAFYCCNNLTDLTINDRVTDIDVQAFFCPALTNIHYPCDNNVDTIWTLMRPFGTYTYIPLDHQFENNACTVCGMEEFVIDESGCLTGYNGIGGDVVIPEGVTSIGDGAFFTCSSLTEVTIPEGVTSIGDSVFFGCTALTEVTISESVTSIGESAFGVCKNLKTVTISDNIQSVGENAFGGGADITTVNYPCGDDLDIIKSYFGVGVRFDATYNAFHVYSARGTLVSEATCTQPAVYEAKCKGCELVQGTMDVGEPFGHTWQDATCTTPKTCSVCGITEGEALGHTFENGICTECGTNVFVIDESGCLTGYNGNGGDVVIPEGVTSIQDLAFYGCIGLTKVTIPDSVTSIGQLAFAMCESITEVIISEGVTSIGESAFETCSSLTEVTIPESVTSIGDHAFGACSNLTEVTISEGVTSIGDFAFESCSSLTEVTIPESVTSIGYSAFCDCSELQTVTITDNIKSVGENAFGGADITTVNYPCGDDLDIIKAYFGDEVWIGITYNVFHVYSGSFKDNNDGTHSQKCRGCSEYNEPQAHTFENGFCTECGYSLPFAFDSVSLVLSGELGLNFYTVVNDAEAVKDGYMLFEIGNKGETQKVYFTDAVLVGERYVFTCKVNALQMADTITVSFHYGDTVVGPKTTSVASYIDKVIENHSNDDTHPTVKLAKSILNYGHYAQIALSELHGFTLGTDYTVTNNKNDVTIANAADLEQYKATKTGSISEITKVTRSLSLDHGTDINLYLTVAEAYEPTVNVTDKNGNTVDFTLEKQADGRYLLIIPQIAAHQLGDMYTVSVDNGTMTINVSALSYAYSVLTSEKSDAQKLCVSALYEYYNAAITYRNAQ